MSRLERCVWFVWV